ncbi:hypothetical protein BVY01_04610, partial [bacterium I07]
MKPLFGANVIVSGTLFGAATDEEGSFVINAVPPGSYWVRVTAIGYQPEAHRIKLGPGDKVVLQFKLGETVLLMDGIAVTASRYKQALQDVPVSLSLIAAKDLSERNINSIDQSLKYVPGVNTHEGGQISIRGSSGFNYGLGSRVMVLYNGNPMMTGDHWAVSWYAIPTSNIKQIEVMKGSGSALYGSSAMGGVINIITQTPEEGNRINIRTHTGFYDRPLYPEWRWTEDNMHFEGTAVDFSTRLGNIETTLSTSYQANSGYKENDDRRIFNFMANLASQVNPRFRIELLSGYGKQDGGFYVYWKSLNKPYHNGSDPYGFRTRSTASNFYAFPSFTYSLNENMFLSLKGRYLSNDLEDKLQNKTSDS